MNVSCVTQKHLIGVSVITLLRHDNRRRPILELAEVEIGDDLSTNVEISFKSVVRFV